MSQEGIFCFSNGFGGSQRQLLIDQQIRKDKLSPQRFQPPPLVAIEEEGPDRLPNPVYDSTAGMLSEMFNFSSGHSEATESLQNQIQVNYQTTRPSPAGEMVNDWQVITTVDGVLGISGDDSKNYEVGEHNSITANNLNSLQISSINTAANSVAAMQLFLVNPQRRSSSPPTSHHLHPAMASTLPMPPSSTSSAQQGLQTTVNPLGTAFGSSQFTWIPDNGRHEGLNPTGIGGVVEGQTLSLSLSSSLETAKAEELKIADGGLLLFNQTARGGVGGSSNLSTQNPYKYLSSHLLHGPMHSQVGLLGQSHQFFHSGFRSSFINSLRNSKYTKSAQELLEEFCSVCRDLLKRTNRLGRNNTNPNFDPNGSNIAGVSGGDCSSSFSRDHLPPLSASERVEHQRRKIKLISMLDEVDRRYNHYCDQMQMVVNSFDLAMGFGAAVPYTCLAQKAMSRHFRCLKDTVVEQLRHSCMVLGERDASTSGITKGETPRLRVLEQSLRQQRAFHQIGLMEQEAWRPQRGLPERSVNVLRAWLFEHFLHPYPSDADKHLLARQTGLSRNQVSNWFINARVRLWKPMVEEMYQQEAKDEAKNDNTNMTCTRTTAVPAQPPTRIASAAITATDTTTTTAAPTGKRSQINAGESDHSFDTTIRSCFSENQARRQPLSTIGPSTLMTTIADPTVTDMILPPPSLVVHSNTHHGGGIPYTEFGTVTVASSGNLDMGGSKLVRFGTTSGDVSLTLGLRHADNLPPGKSAFSIGDF